MYITRFEKVLEVVRRLLPAGSAIVDLGSAQGNFSITLAGETFTVVAVDVRRSFLQYSALKVSTETERANFNPVVGSALALPLQDEAFQGVLALEVLEHTTLPLRLLQEAFRILSPGGAILVTTPNQKRVTSAATSFSRFTRGEGGVPAFGDSARGDQHVFEFTPDEVAATISQAGFQVQSSEPLVSLLASPVGWAPRSFVTTIESATVQLPAALASRLMSTTLVVGHKPLRSPHSNSSVSPGSWRVRPA